MSQTIYLVPPEWSARSWADENKYLELYQQSCTEPERFWCEMGKRIEWIKPYTKVKNTSYEPQNVFIKWYEDGTLNACANCVDRHVTTRGDQVAIIWEGDDPNEYEEITYRQLLERVSRVANVLLNNGVKKGDCITIYMPMVPEVAYAMLACARIGAVHSVIFAGFSPDSLADRIIDSGSRFIITADEAVRGGCRIPLKANIDAALALISKGDSRVLVMKRTGAPVHWTPFRDLWLHEELINATADCQPVEMNAEDPLFILYTSGSTAKPKGILHTTGGYITWVSLTHQYVFDYHDGDIYWCTADVGWITGHSYILYGPLANGATTLIFEGVPHYPTTSRFWQVLDKWSVNTVYTAPTTIRALMAAGDDFVKHTSRASLRLLGSVGEPINPETWEWYHKTVGESRCPIVDTWWQTETGGIMIAPLPGTTKLKPGSAALPFFGIVPALINDKGEEEHGSAKGHLIIKDSWPGQMR